MAFDWKPWIEKALADLKTAEYNLKGDEYEFTAFLCQQAAEKALKAVFIKRQGELIKTHELVFLGRKVGLPENLIEKCHKLSPFFVITRYPDSVDEITEEDAQFALAVAKEVVEWAQKQV